MGRKGLIIDFVVLATRNPENGIVLCFNLAVESKFDRNLEKKKGREERNVVHSFQFKVNRKKINNTLLLIMYFWNTILCVKLLIRTKETLCKSH